MLSSFFSSKRSASAARNPKRASVQPEVETLERRDTPSGASLRLRADPNESGHKILVVDGTRRNDTIKFGKEGGQLTVTLNGAERGAYKLKKISQVVASGEGGNGKITMSPRLRVECLFNGGGGNDVLRGGRGANFLYGDAGDDYAYGGDHSDWLDGGSGNDYLFGYGGSDSLWGQDGTNSYYGGDGLDYFFGDSSDTSASSDYFYDFDASDYSYGSYSDYNSGYTYRIGEVNPYTGTSSYRYYDDYGTWNSWYYSSPYSSWDLTMSSWYQDLANSGYSRIGTVNPYSNNYDYGLYDSAGDYSGFRWGDTFYSWF